MYIICQKSNFYPKIFLICKSQLFCPLSKLNCVGNSRDIDLDFPASRICQESKEKSISPFGFRGALFSSNSRSKSKVREEVKTCRSISPFSSFLPGNPKILFCSTYFNLSDKIFTTKKIVLEVSSTRSSQGLNITKKRCF